MNTVFYHDLTIRNAKSIVMPHANYFAHGGPIKDLNIDDFLVMTRMKKSTAKTNNCFSIFFV
jgi:hypothetical protein